MFHIIEGSPRKRPLKPALLPLLAVVTFTTITADQAPPLSADAVARRVQDRDTGRDSRMTFRMRLFDRHNRARERVMAVDGLRGRTAPGASPIWSHGTVVPVFVGGSKAVHVSATGS